CCPDFPNSFYADFIHVGVVAVQKYDVDLGHVRVDRHQILGEVGVEIASGALVNCRLLMQRHRNAVHDSANHLTSCRLRVQDTADVVGSDHASDVNVAELGIDLDLDKDGAEGMHRVPFAFGTWSSGRSALDDVAMCERTAAVDVLDMTTERRDALAECQRR